MSTLHSDQAQQPRRTIIERRVRAEIARERAAYVRARRIVELTRLYRARHGHTLPDNAAGRRAVEVMAHHIADPHRIRMWCELWAAWLTADDVAALLYDVVRFRRSGGPTISPTFSV